ncbi:MAG: cupin domain-containing protein [Myxococcota bacterium]
MSDLRPDLSILESVDTTREDWVASPSAQVLRKRVHRVGPAESGQVTSVVRYLPGAAFPAHDHPEGEEILVLDGVFSDEHGDWPAGTYLLNPEGFRHAPFSKEGCDIFVKLRQFPGTDREHIAIQTRDLPWAATETPGLERKALYAQSSFRDTTTLERWTPELSSVRSYPEGAELFVIEGQWEDASDVHGPGTWLRLPTGAEHTPRVSAPCVVYVKRGGFAYLNPSEAPAAT